jgi:hypothetical protein
MLLFNKLMEEDQHNAIHYCMHLVVEDMLEDGVQLEPFSDEDKKMRSILEKAIDEAKKLPEDQQFEFVVTHQEAGQLVFDIALDMARSAYYPEDDELVINFESLRHDHVTEEEHPSDVTELFEELEEIKPNKKSDNSLN